MKNAVITGVTSGIGQATAENLKADGWNVIGLSRTSENYRVDLADLNAVGRVGDKIADKLGRIDAFIHVAGVWHDDEQALDGRKLHEFTEQQIVDTMNVGLTSFLVLAVKLLPKMPKNGVIIAISGTFADGGAGWVPYYVSKRSVEDLVVGLTQDYPEGPKVFGVSPADTATPAYKKFYPQYAADAQAPEVIARLSSDLINSKTEYNSGEIIEIRNGQSKSGYHQ